MSEDPTMPPEEDTVDGVVPKSLGAVRHKYKQAAFRHLKKLLKERLEECPSNCVHNRIRVMPNGARAGLCRCLEMGDDDWAGICDNRFTPSQPESCGHFDFQQTKDEIKTEFREFLDTAQLHEIAARYPDLAPLLWVMGNEAPGREETDVEDWEPGEEVCVEIYGKVLTAGNAEEAEYVVEALSDLERGNRGLREKVEKLEGVEEELAATEKAHNEALESRDQEIERYHKALEEARSERDEWKHKALVAQPEPPDLPAPTGFKGVLWRWLTETKP